MEYFSQYIVLLTQRKDFDNWVNILVVVMLAIFWLVGGLVKTMGKKTQYRRKPGAQAPPKPPMRPQKTPQADSQEPPPVPSSTRLRPQPQLRKRLEKAARPWRPTVHEPSVRPKKTALMPSLEHAVQPEQQIKFPQQLSSRPIEQTEAAQAIMTSKKPTLLAASNLILDISSPEELRKAILYYEILGKPLALRGPHSPLW